ncbi:hypothetical protein [Pseudomonas urethralis]|uniref:hypothetical protein n=1 Tax=Pseudomonas urethralis TaxID=2740517 RepID=UPI001F26BB90|nr:hypothetical protein [Pseudomonas urethralis]
MSDVSTVTGKLEVVGPSNDKPDGSEYTYLRFSQTDGGTKLMKKVGVGQLIESYLRPGMEGQFFLRQTWPAWARSVCSQNCRRAANL